MAAPKAKATPVGSTQWIQNEKSQAAQLVSMDVEEFSFSVRNELDWLNEHMGDIFSKSQKNFADMFKTPSRMRGKTPRTTRKRDSIPTRQPLTDIFASDAPSVAAAVQAIDFQAKPFSLSIPISDENEAPQRPISRGKSPNRVGVPYTDSGYHGMMTEDEMELDGQVFSVDDASQTQELSQPMVSYGIVQPTAQTKDGKADETGTSEESFVSAEEAMAAKIAAAPVEIDVQMSDDATVPDEEPVLTRAVHAPVRVLDEAPSHPDPMEIDDGNQSQSELSSPENPLQRKSSFTFSALPAREPLAAKRSMGNRNSQKDFQLSRNSTLSRSVGGKNVDSEQREAEVSRPYKPNESEVRNKTSTQLLHERITMLGKTKEPRPSKSIPLNGPSAPAAYPQLPDLESEASIFAKSIPQPMRESGRGSTTIADDDDEDWIAPTKPSHHIPQSQSAQHLQSPVRPGLHKKSISASNLPSASKPMGTTSLGHNKALSVSQPNLKDTQQSTTPIGSPLTKKTTEGTISASKNRLWSALKSAKSIFASSASTSAAAKLEAHNNSPLRFASPARNTSNNSNVLNMPGALLSERDLPQSPTRPISVISLSPKRTRSSTESDRKREKEAKEQHKSMENLEKARELERKKAAKEQQEEALRREQARSEDQQASTAQGERAPSADNDHTLTNSKSISSFKSSILSSGKLRAPGRPVRPTRGAAQSKPAPVSIRVASQSQRLGQGPTTAGISKAQHDSSTAGSATKDAPTSRPGSAQSSKGGSSAPVNARVKALEAAARKKEADERAALKKAEHKRELERKRALKAEEEKRAEEERKAAEQQRLQEAKLAAQRKAEKQAADARRREQERAEQQRREQERAEQQRREQERQDQERRREHERAEQLRREQERMEQLRQQEDTRKAREAHELAERINQERAQQAQQAHPRSDVGGTIRQLIKHTIPQLNPAKPAKRNLQGEEDESVQRPGMQRGPPSYQQNDAKRRRTNEEPDEPEQRRSVMAPPKRPSNLRKETLSKFPHGYTHAAGSMASQHGPNMFKAAVTAQHQLYNPSKGPGTHPSQMVQISNARIPFAENNNPPAAHHPSTSQQYHRYENNHPSANANKFKTPARPGHAPKSAKSSPLYPNGDLIALPEIATDSEDEGSDDDGPTGGFRAPSWVASPALRDLLTQQQLVDPESVFGPIAELKMDEVFKGAKNPERLKKFRDRGSSALWIESGDAVTSAEKRRDMEMRERVVRDGGWRYEPGM